MGRFASTVEFYRRYREPYPAEFFQSVASRLRFSGNERLLDVGCGPGLLAIGFAPYVASCTGLDPEPGMIAAAQTAAGEAAVDLKLLQTRLEDLPHGNRPYDVVTIGRALHWLDRDTALPVLDRVVPVRGFVLVCGAPVSDAPINVWVNDYKAVRNAYSSQDNDARYRIDLQAWFAPSRFRQVDRITVSATQQVTVEDLVRRGLSMSTTSPEALGHRRSAFEQDMSRAVAPFAVDGIITEQIEAIATVFS